MILYNRQIFENEFAQHYLSKSFTKFKHKNRLTRCRLCNTISTRTLTLYVDGLPNAGQDSAFHLQDWKGLTMGMTNIQTSYRTWWGHYSRADSVRCNGHRWHKTPVRRRTNEKRVSMIQMGDDNSTKVT